MRDRSTLKGYTTKEVKLTDELLRFLANRNPRKKYCSFIEPTFCDACHEKIEIVRFILKLLKSNQEKINSMKKGI